VCVCVYIYISAHRAAMVHRVPDRPTDRPTDRPSERPPVHPPRHLVFPAAVPPAKINKGTINKNYIFFIHRRGVRARGGREDWEMEDGGCTPRVRAFDLFSFIFAGARWLPRHPRLPSFPSFFFFLPFAIRGERGGLSCYLRATAGDIVAVAPGNMSEFGY